MTKADLLVSIPISVWQDHKRQLWDKPASNPAC